MDKKQEGFGSRVAAYFKEQAIPLGVLLGMIIIASLLTRVFFTRINMQNLLIQQAATMVVSLGMFACILSGGIDLSVGSQLAVASVFMATLLNNTNFVVAVLLQYLFAIVLNWLPIGLWNEGFRSTILPTLALSISPMAESCRFIRTEMVEVLSSDYIELARAKGMSEIRIAFSHGLRNALIPLITVLGPMTVSLMTGSLVVENIFAVPGIGEQFTKSILSNDYYTIMAVTILFSALLVAVIFLTDILYQIIDPRVRVEGAK